MSLRAAFALSLVVLGCRTSGTLDAPVPTTAVSLGQDLKPAARLGRLPIPVDTDDVMQRYALQPIGAATEYLIVVTPDKVDGKITVPLGNGSSSADAAVVYNEYLNQLLRAHRHLLRGEVRDAMVVLDRLDERFDQSYGGLVLRGNLHYLLGNAGEAARQFELARRIFPGAKALEGVKR